MASSLAKKQKLFEESTTLDVISLDKLCIWRKSEAIAIKYCELDESFKEITYAQLYAAHIEISDILEDVNSSQFVGIAYNISAYCLPALMLGITSSCRAFVCLPSLPAEIERISEKLNISHIFTHQGFNTMRIIRDFTVHGEKTFLTRRKEMSHDSKDVLHREEPNYIFAYAITTSGTTGEPKIVRVTHASIIPNILDLKKILQLTETDIIAQITPPTFDPSLIEIFLSLHCEGTLLMISSDLKNDSEILLKILVKNRVTVLQSTPSLLLQRWSSEQLTNSILGKHTELRILLLGGENFPNERIFSKIRSIDNETRIFDIYGITEVSCWASIREIDRYDFTRGLGNALSKTIFEVRDEEGETIEDGEGTLHIGSNSRICVIDDEDIGLLDRPVFRDTGDIAVIDQNGRISIKGRRGRRVKRYGTKLCLTDLDNHVQQLSFVENCYALFMENNHSLHLYFTIFNKSASEIEKKTYETEVSKKTKELSDVHRPDKIILLSRFELTSNGKICMNFLKKSSRKLTRDSATNGDESKSVKTFDDIWKYFLSSDEESGFLNSGGSSMMALRIANELEDKIGHKFPKLLGHLLRNENLTFCREYISSEICNFSNSAKDFRNMEKSSQDENNETFERFLAENRNKSIEVSRKQNKSNDKILPWQKCRGRSNFPISEETKREKGWKGFTKIRLKNRYDLGKCVDASPTIFSYPGGKNYVTVGSHAGVICTVELSNENFVESWKISLPDRIEASILVVNDFRGIVGSYDTFVYCIDLKTGEKFWKFKTSDIVKCTAVLCSRRQNVFFGSYDRKAYCVSLENGTKVWSVKPGNGSICATPCINDEQNSVLFATLDGTCVSLKQNNGEINWLQKFDYPIFSAPIILENGAAVFCDVSGNLNFISIATGQKICNVKIEGNIFSHFYVHTDLVTKIQSILFASENKNIYKMQCFSDSTRPIFCFTKNIGAPIASTPFTDGFSIVVACNDGNLKILDFINGDILYNFQLNGDVFSSPLIHDDFIVVGCRDNYLYVLSRYDVD